MTGARLRGAVLAVAALIAALLVLPARVDAAGTLRDPAAMFRWINGERRWNGMRPLLFDPDLARQAELQARRMADSGQPGHSPLGELSWWAGRGWTLGVAENVAWCTAGEAPWDEWSMHQVLVGSAPHRANMLNPNHRGVGVALVERDGLLWAAQVYGGF